MQRIEASPNSSAASLTECGPNNFPVSGTGEYVAPSRAIERIHQQILDKTKPRGQTQGVAIVGGSGFGKMELAIRYGDRYQSHYTGGLVWLNCRGSDLFVQLIQFARLRMGMDVPAAQQTLALPEMTRWYLDHWKAAGDVLLAIEDVRQASDIQPLLAQLPERFNVLITTRQGGLHQDFWELPLDLPTREAAIAILDSLIGRRATAAKPATKTLCKKVGFLPLGLQLVGSYLAAHPLLSISEASQGLFYGDRRLKVTGATRPTSKSMQDGVRAAFDLTWQQLSEPAQLLGKLLSFFAPVDIPGYLVNQLAAIAGIPDTHLAAAKASLYKHHLVQNVGTETLRLHPQVQKCLLNKLSVNQDPSPKTYIRALANFAKELADKIEAGLGRTDLVRIAPAIPHLVDLLTHQAAHVPNKRLWPLLAGVIGFYKSQIILSEACYWAEQAPPLLQSRLGNHHPHTIDSLNTLASVYAAQGRHSEAEALVLNAIAADEQVSESADEQDRPDIRPDAAAIASRLNNLAHIYAAQGRYFDAEQSYKKALEVTRDSEAYLESAKTLTHLAKLYQEQGRHAPSEKLFQNALDIKLRHLGEGHPDVANALYNLATSYAALKRYRDATELSLTSLKITRKSLGDDHPAVAERLTNLAELYQRQGQLGESENLLAEALKLTRNRVGTTHPDTALALGNLAELYSLQGRYREADPLLVEAIAISRHLLGKDHPQVALYLNDLATCEVKQRRYYEAENHYMEAIGIAEYSLGSDHPTLTAYLDNLTNARQDKKLYHMANFLLMALFGVLVVVGLQTLFAGFGSGGLNWTLRFASIVLICCLLGLIWFFKTRLL